MFVGSSRRGDVWSREDDKKFERALVMYPEGTVDRWERIAEELPGKRPADVRDHYDMLLHDVAQIDSGLVQLPAYSPYSFTPDSPGRNPAHISFGPSASSSASAKSRSSDTSDRKKGVPWTEEEHRLFLIGLQKYGKGDWRSISRNAVVSRTPTQVASHAQKYYLRLNSGKKEKKRNSIHDITTPTQPSPQPTGPYMGQFRDPGSLGHGYPM